MKRSANRGFTLLEVLTATAILMMACVLVLKISMQVIDTWGAASEKSSGGVETGLALDIMEEDLETSFPHFWVYDEVHSEGMKKCFRLCFYRQGRDSDWSALAYQVGYDDAKKRYGLYRYEVTEKKDIKDMADLSELFSPYQLGLEKIVSPSNLLAKNIINFSVKFLYKDNKSGTQWTLDGSFFSRLPICAEILLTTDKGQQITRRVPFMVNGRL